MVEQVTLERPTDTQAHQGSSGGPIATALGGALAGAVGTWALDRADWLMWDNESDESRQQTRDVRPYGEPPAHVIARKAEMWLGSEPSPQQHEAAGQVIHYGLGITPAIGYAFLRDRLPGQGIARGMLYGAGLFALQDEGLNSVTGLGAKPSQYPWQAHARGLVAHLVYGAVTEIALSTIEKALGRRTSSHPAKEAVPAFPDQLTVPNARQSRAN